MAFNLFIFGCVVFVAVCGLSLVVASGGYSICGVQASHCGSFSCCRAWAWGCMGSVVVAHGPGCPRHVESSRRRDWTHVPSIGRWPTSLDHQGSSDLANCRSWKCIIFLFPSFRIPSPLSYLQVTVPSLLIMCSVYCLCKEGAKKQI